MLCKNDPRAFWKRTYSVKKHQENISCFGCSHNFLSWSDPQQASQRGIISCKILIFFSSNCVQPWFVSSLHLASRGRCVLLAAYPRPFDWSHHLHFPLSHCVWYRHHHPIENWALHIPLDWPVAWYIFKVSLHILDGGRFWMEVEFWRQIYAHFFLKFCLFSHISLSIQIPHSKSI